MEGPPRLEVGASLGPDAFVRPEVREGWSLQEEVVGGSKGMALPSVSEGGAEVRGGTQGESPGVAEVAARLARSRLDGGSPEVASSGVRGGPEAVVETPVAAGPVQAAPGVEGAGVVVGRRAARRQVGAGGGEREAGQEERAGRAVIGDRVHGKRHVAWGICHQAH